jgi:hypothetical protein
MSAYLAGVTGAPLTSTVIAMELTDNRSMVIPIMAACLLARAAASIFCPTPVYKDFAERMVQDFERQQALLAEAGEQAGTAASSEHIGPTSAYSETAMATDVAPEPPAEHTDP